MNEKTLIDTLEANRLMRSPDEVAAFEQALAELAQHPSNEYLPDLHLILDDLCCAARGDVQFAPLTKSRLK